MAKELGVGYISILPEVSKITPGIAKALDKSEQVADKSSKKMGDKIAGNISKSVKIGAGAAAASVTGLMATAIGKGFTRITALDDAKAKLKGLKLNAEQVESAMTSVNKSVKGTSFGLDEAANSAAKFVSSNVEVGKSLDRVMGLTADIASQSGASMDEISSILAKITGTGKLTGETLAELDERAVGVSGALSKHLGISIQEVRDQVFKGKIDVETFSAALEEHLGGAAKKSGDTIKGSFKNTFAALGRLGATVVTPFTNQAVEGFKSTSEAIDALNERVKPAAKVLDEFLTKRGVPALRDFGNSAKHSLGQLSTSMGTMMKSLRTSVGPEISKIFKDITHGVRTLGQSGLLDSTVHGFKNIIDALGEMAPSVVSITGSLGKAASSLGVGAWSVFNSTLSITASVLKTISPMLEKIADVMEDHPALVTAAVGAWTGFKTIPGIISKVTDAIKPVGGIVREMGSDFKLCSAYITEINPSTGKAEKGIRSVGFAAKEAGKRLGGSLVNGAKGVVAALGGPWGIALTAAAGAVMYFYNESKELNRIQEEMAKTSIVTANSQKVLAAELHKTGNVMNDTARQAVKDYADAISTEFRGLGELYQSQFKRDILSFGQSSKLMGNLIVGNFENTQKVIEDYSKRANSGEGYKALQEVLKETGLTLNDVIASAAEGGEQYSQVMRRLQEQSAQGVTGSDYAIEQLKRFKQQVEDLKAAAERVDPSFMQISEGFTEIAESAGSSDKAVDGFRKAMEAAGLISVSSQQSMADLNDKIREVQQSFTSSIDPAGALGQALIGTNGQIDTTTANGSALFDTLSDLSQQFLDTVAKTGDTEGAVQKMSGAFDVLAQSTGLPREQIEELARTMGYLPDEASIMFTLQGADQVAVDLATVDTYIKSFPDQKEVNIGAVISDTAVDELKNLGFEVERIPETKETKITVADEEARGKLTQIVDHIDLLDGKNITVETLVNNDKIFDDLSAIGVEIDNVDGNIELTTNSDEQLEKVRSLGDQVQEIANNPGKFTFESNIGDIKRDADSLNGYNTTSQHTVNDNVNDVVGRLTGILGVANTSAQHTQKDNVDEENRRIHTLDSANTQADHKQRDNVDQVSKKISTLNHRKTIGEHFQNVKMKLLEIFNAEGSIRTNAAGSISYNANGKLSQQDAQIVPGGRWITWAEDETQGESFIPHAKSKRKRSTQILAETAGIFGMSVIDNKTGKTINRDGSDLGQVAGSVKYFENGAFRATSVISHFAKGAVKTANEINEFAKGIEGKPYVWGGVNWGDCSGAMSAIARFATGLAPFAGRFATGNEGAALASMGFKPGRGKKGALRMGWFNGGPYGGHTAGTLPNNINVEMGGGRGNGQYGGPAAGSDDPQFTDHAYLPVNMMPTLKILKRIPEIWNALVNSTAKSVFSALGARNFVGSGVGLTGTLLHNADGSVRQNNPNYTVDEGIPGIKSTSRNGIITKLGGFIPWEKLDKVYKLLHPEDTKVYDVGGVLPHGAGAVNNSGKNELVLTNDHWKNLSEIARALPAAGRAILDAVNNERTRASKDVNSGLSGLFNGDKNVIKATNDYYDTLQKIADENEDVTEATNELHDAERKLQEARDGGKPEDVQKAQEEVNKAEEKLTTTRQKTEDQSKRLQEAERELAAARMQSFSDLFIGVGDAFKNVFNGIGAHFEEMSRLASIVEKTRQEVSKLEMEQEGYHIASMNSLHALRQREFDVTAARLMGAISVAEAEGRLEDARAAASKLGLTSVEALRGALDRYYETGKFGIEELTESQIENNNKVKAAEWAVYVARAQAAIDLQEATYQQSLAQYKVSEATLMQMKSAEMLRLQTELLEKQTAELHGMSSRQASAAAKGITGAGKIAGGIGKVLGGIAATIGGFFLGGPVGAAAGIGLVTSGIADVTKGSIDVKQNKKETAELWKKMTPGQKAAVIGGGILGGTAGIAGGVGGAVYGGEFSKEMSGVSDNLITATIGSYTYSIKSKIEKLNEDAEAKIADLNNNIKLQELALDNMKARLDLDHLTKTDALKNDKQYGELMKNSYETDNEKTRQAYLDAAAAFKQNNTEILKATNSNGEYLAAIKDGIQTLTSNPSDAAQVDILTKILGKIDMLERNMNNTSGVEYMTARA